MGQPSTIDRLPPAILEQLQELLRQPGAIQLEVTARINELLTTEGYETQVSKSAVNRYSLSMKEAGAKLQQSREVAKMWIGKLGAAPLGQVGNLVNEILRTLAFDLSLKLQNEELTAESMPEVVDQLKSLSLAAMRLEKAASENVKREEEIRKQERERIASEMSKAANKAGSGLSAEALRTIRRDVLRMAE